jgi:hypothetical protein
MTVAFTVIYIRYNIAFAKVILNLQNTASKFISIVIGEIVLNTLQFSSVWLLAQGLTRPQG